MCLLIIAHGRPELPLAVAANRDEFHARPTAQAGFWPERPALLAGRDLAQGGTWMGVTRGGRFAAVTNRRDATLPVPGERSRGELPLDFLCGDESPEAFLAEVAARRGAYAGFNLLVGGPGELWYFRNTREAAPQRLQPGLYGLAVLAADAG